ncbi:MBOAT family protein [Segetibacter sp. 3557_3]|uniref:MBOAT family O-acyltransferase n=1 Tax=Segetibacter sp. 3557_3 TaxID=2547429 RepID=UPI0010583FBE|nr:MBOAT family O-acyltransferase [Segetibacter sp. 3557_3]TDH26466.1 MBOAT family protein [Segetibacter sp. 3557_3]
MVFNSLTFVVFFAIMLVLHNLPLAWKVKKTNLLLASYLFYAAWNPPFILLLWLSTVVDFFVGKALYTQQNPTKKKLLLVVSLIGNLGMLCFFKYGNFLLENFVQLMSVIGLDFHPAKPNIILPAGISFYTFTTLCYTIDMYKKRSEPVKSLLDFSLFVTFFPHLVAGPIVRPEQLVPQFETARKANQTQLLRGLFLLSLGLFMKVVLADGMLASPADTVFGSQAPLATLDAWMGVLAFSGQIFFDFAGYSTCAIAVAMCLGFVLPENFKYPYAANGFSDFWKRWHITLSTWLRDYLYIPLGGNRNGKFRTHLNLMITMLLGGLWHGANWTFVVWGGLHGLFLVVEKLIQDFTKKQESVVVKKRAFAIQGISGVELLRAASSSRLFVVLLTFFLVNVTWVFFRSPDFTTSWRLLTAMFTNVKGGAAVLPTLTIIKVAVIITLMLVCHWVMRNRRVLPVSSKIRWWVLGIVWAAMVILLMLSQESSNSFIYFQF